MDQVTSASTHRPADIDELMATHLGHWGAVRAQGRGAGAGGVARYEERLEALMRRAVKEASSEES